MPRAIGTSTGVNETLTGCAAYDERFCSISGVCRCTPPTPYADAEPITSAPSRCGFGALPAPDVPLTATTTSWVASTSPCCTAGSRASVETVGEQPGTATRFDPRSLSRCPGSSGSPYGHEPACSPP